VGLEGGKRVDDELIGTCSNPSVELGAGSARCHEDGSCVVGIWRAGDESTFAELSDRAGCGGRVDPQQCRDLVHPDRGVGDDEVEGVSLRDVEGNVGVVEIGPDRPGGTGPTEVAPGGSDTFGREDGLRIRPAHTLDANTCSLQGIVCIVQPCPNRLPLPRRFR